MPTQTLVITNRRAVCGRTARAVRREGRLKPIDRPYPYQYDTVLSDLRVSGLSPACVCRRFTALEWDDT